ncbi:MAG TPA: hypothetical protein VL117_01810 [Thermoleophilia bacterium]|nr:hypothetical protein [Thermoleophilia bacterium]
MIRVIVQLNDEQWVAAREQARSEGLSLAAFVRHAVDARLARAESARDAVVRRALAAIDGLSDAAPPPGCSDQADRCGADEQPDRCGPDGQGGVPRYWLDEPLEEPPDDATEWRP